MSLFAATPLSLIATVGAITIGSAVTVPIVTNGVSGSYLSVHSLFADLGCANLTKGKTTKEEGDIYLCNFSKITASKSNFPKLKMFYQSKKSGPKKIVKISSNSSQKEVQLTLENGVVISAKEDSKFISSWIKYEDKGGEVRELIPEKHCSIGWGLGETRNLYNFVCSLGNQNNSNIWASKAEPFRFVYSPETDN